MHNQLTIVIPCKNEKNIILKTLDLLNFQHNIEHVQIIICDASDDGITRKLLLNRKKRKSDRFKLTIIQGGIPAVARNKGFERVKTEYVLFLDSDVFLYDRNTISKSLSTIQDKQLDLVTPKFRSELYQYDYIFKAISIIQLISKWITPFCFGGYMLFNSNKFRELNGFDVEIKIAEDYHLSKQIKPKKFNIIDTIVYTPPRRFQKNGVFYMVKLMIQSFVMHKNKKWFNDDKNYWK